MVTTMMDKEGFKAGDWGSCWTGALGLSDLCRVKFGKRSQALSSVVERCPLLPVAQGKYDFLYLPIEARPVILFTGAVLQQNHAVPRARERCVFVATLAAMTVNCSLRLAAMIACQSNEAKDFRSKANLGYAFAP